MVLFSLNTNSSLLTIPETVVDNSFAEINESVFSFKVYQISVIKRIIFRRVSIMFALLKVPENRQSEVFEVNGRPLDCHK